MENIDRSKKAGMIGMAGAALWFLSLVLEYTLGLQPPAGSGALYVANQLLAFAGLAGIAYGYLGIWWGKGVINKFGEIAVFMFVVGYALAVIAGILSIILRIDDSPIFILFPIGGVLSDLGALLTGIAVIRARQWGSWHRFMPLVYALILWLVIEIPFILEYYPDGPGFFPETIQATGLFFTGLAVFQARKKTE